MSKHLPPKPKFSRPYDWNPRRNLNQDMLTSIEFNEWYARQIEPLFKDAQEVKGNYENGWATTASWSAVAAVPWATYSGLVIGIKPLKEPSAEDLLRELHDAVLLRQPTSEALKKANAYLAKQKGE